MNKPLNFAVMGVNGIGNSIAKTLSGMKEATLYAAASRDIGRARDFAKKWGAEKAYGSYKEMLADSAVDIVHVAVPHTFHYECMLQCIEAGKHILCEKPFTVNKAQAEDVLNRAAKKNLFVAEATWTRYQPSRFLIDDIIKSGVVGRARSVMAGFNCAGLHVDRLWKKELGGGALLDMGVYPLNFAFSVFGDDVKEVHSSITRLPSGVDGTCAITLIYGGGEVAQLLSSVEAVGENRGIIQCEKGAIIAEPIVYVKKIIVKDMEGKTIADYSPETRWTGYEYEVLACKKGIDEGKSEPPEHTHAHILKQMELLDAMRAEWGVKYHGE